jgi:hypothetical protein
VVVFLVSGAIALRRDPGTATTRRNERYNTAYFLDLLQFPSMKRAAWFRSLALSGLFAGAQRLAEGLKGVDGNLTLAVAATTVAASVVSSYLTNRANSQREAQLDTAVREKLAQRNHHLRRGLAASLRRALQEAQLELIDLPANPYHALFASWNYTLHLASTDDAALERFFPIGFTESQWQAINPYSPNSLEDENALAELLKSLLKADAIYKNWSHSDALHFARRALPFYHRAFADAIAGDTEGSLYRALEIKGVNEIRALVKREIAETRALHEQTQALVQQEATDNRTHHEQTWRKIDDLTFWIKRTSIYSAPTHRLPSGTEAWEPWLTNLLRNSSTYGYSHLTANYLELLSSNADPTIRPEVWQAIARKLRQDFRQGALSAPLKYKKVHLKAEADVKPITSKADLDRFSYLDSGVVSDQSWWGKFEEKSVNLVRGAVETLGHPILVSCSSVNVAAYAVLKGFRRHGIASVIVPDDASGREQAISLARNPKFDFVVCADAPLFLEAHDNVRAYVKVFDIYNEEQGILRKGELVSGKSPTAYIYQASSAKQQFLLDRARAGGSLITEDVAEEPLTNMADFALVSEIMDPGDLVIAWGALEESLLTDPTFRKVENADFALTVSMFRHPIWLEMPEALDALFDLFVAEWNFCKAHEFTAFERLLGDCAFVESFARGGGYNKKFSSNP